MTFLEIEITNAIAAAFAQDRIEEPTPVQDDPIPCDGAREIPVTSAV